MRTVCIVCDGYWDQLQGGAEYQLMLLGHGLARRGFAVHYLYTDRGTPVQGGDVLLEPMRLPRLLRRLAYPYHVLLAPQLLSALRRLTPDIIINRVGSAFTGISAWYGKRHGIPVLWHIADITDVEPPELPRNRTLPFAWLDRLCLDYGIRHCSHVIAQADYQDALLQAHFGRRATAVIPNFHPAPVTPVVKDTVPLIVWIANLKPKKRPEIFIEMARRLAPRLGARFVMVGRPAEGRYQGTIEQLLASAPEVEYLGERAIDDVNALLARAWVFVNSSAVEGFPNTFVQAWLRDVAVVSLDFDPDGLIASRGLGRLSGSLDGLCKDVTELVEQPETRNRIVMAARIHAARQHALDPNIDRIAGVMAQAIEKGVGRGS